MRPYGYNQITIISVWLWLSFESVGGHVLGLGAPYQIAIDVFRGLSSNSNASLHLISIEKSMKLLMATLPST